MRFFETREKSYKNYEFPKRSERADEKRKTSSSYFHIVKVASANWKYYVEMTSQELTLLIPHTVSLVWPVITRAQLG